MDTVDAYEQAITRMTATSKDMIYNGVDEDWEKLICTSF